jgi:hypothetical protein
MYVAMNTAKEGTWTAANCFNTVIPETVRRPRETPLNLGQKYCISASCCIQFTLSQLLPPLMQLIELLKIKSYKLKLKPLRHVSAHFGHHQAMFLSKTVTLCSQAKTAMEHVSVDSSVAFL